MRRRAIVTIGLATGMLLGMETDAVPYETAGNPYQSIADRNVFGLKPPPPPESVTNVPPPIKVQLLGIFKMSGVLKTILKILDPPKAGQPSQTEPFVLSEGEAQQDIEVKEINEKDGAVKIINHGIAMTLTFKDDGAKMPAGPAQGTPAPTPSLASFPAPRTFGQGVPAGAPTQPLVIGAAKGGLTTAATPDMRNAPNVPRLLRTPEPPPFSREEQVILIEAQREAAKQAGDPMHRIFPPTEMTPKEDLAPGAEPTPPQPPGF